jgi:hypothetical protein
MAANRVAVAAYLAEEAAVAEEADPGVHRLVEGVVAHVASGAWPVITAVAERVWPVKTGASSRMRWWRGRGGGVIMRISRDAFMGVLEK